MRIPSSLFTAANAEIWWRSRDPTKTGPDGKLKPCDIPNCSWCDPKGAMKAMDKTTASCTYCGKTGVAYPHYCDNLDHPIDAPPDLGGTERLAVETNPNRFDPYEALDRIAGLRVLGLGEEIRSDSCLGDFDAVRVHLNALRAYITGMEK